MHLSFNLQEKASKISNIAKALCIWDFNTFDDEGVYGRMSDGWFKAQNPFLEYVILMTFTGGAGRGEWVSLDAAGRPYSASPGVHQWELSGSVPTRNAQWRYSSGEKCSRIMLPKAKMYSAYS